MEEDDDFSLTVYLQIILRHNKMLIVAVLKLRIAANECIFRLHKTIVSLKIGVVYAFHRQVDTSRLFTITG